MIPIFITVNVNKLAISLSSAISITEVPQTGLYGNLQKSKVSKHAVSLSELAMFKS